MIDGSFASSDFFHAQKLPHEPARQNQNMEFYNKNSTCHFIATTY